MFWSKRKNPEPVSTELVDACRAINEKLSRLSEPDDDLTTTSYAVVERMESLENRFEELRGMCLRHVQSASQRLKRAEDLTEEREFNGDPPSEISEAPPMHSENGVSDDEISDLQWGVQQLRARGQQAII